MVFRRCGLLLPHAHAPEEEGRRREGGGVEHGDGAAAEHGIEAGPRERRDDPQALARGREHAVRLREELLREHDLEQRRAGGVEDGAEGPVGERDRVDQPGVAAVVDEQQHEHERAEHAVGDDHQRPPAHPVGEQPTERREQRARGEGEERQPGERARAGQRLHPDREDDQHRPVAERRQRLAGEQQPGVAVREEGAHQARSRAR